MKKQEALYQDEKYLDKRLAVYAGSDYYPFHMPGHKRAELEFENPYKIDITEIEGFDNLHHAEDILSESQERLRQLYQSRKAYYLVNGSTCGLLSAVGALVKAGDHILIARNCHKAVYNAVKIFSLKVHYVYPQLMSCGIQGKIDPGQIEQQMIKHPEIKLAVITSPTFEGIVSDIREIHLLALKYHFYLIVDEAHGAHFSLSRHFPESAVRQNADLVIQSLHKTLPSFTQTAVLHAASDRIDCGKVEEMLAIFQTSSPSYVLMAGMERCVRLLEQSKEQLFEAYHQRLVCFYEGCRQLKCLHVLTKEDYKAYDVSDADSSKIVISTLHTAVTGRMLYQILLEKYHLQLEMHSAQYALAMTSIMDTQEGFDRLLNALIEIDFALDNNKKARQNAEEMDLFLEQAYAVRKKAMEISQAGDCVEETILSKSIGAVSAEYVYLYPPGIPMIVPGEIITSDFIEILEKCRKLDLNVQGMKDRQHQKILTVKK